MIQNMSCQRWVPCLPTTKAWDNNAKRRIFNSLATSGPLSCYPSVCQDCSIRNGKHSYYYLGHRWLVFHCKDFPYTHWSQFQQREQVSRGIGHPVSWTTRLQLHHLGFISVHIFGSLFPSSVCVDLNLPTKILVWSTSLPTRYGLVGVHLTALSSGASATGTRWMQGLAVTD